MQEAMKMFFQMCLQSGGILGAQTEARTTGKPEDSKNAKKRRKLRSQERKRSRGRRRRRSEDEEQRRSSRKEKEANERKPPKKSKDRDEDPDGEDSDHEGDDEESEEEEEEFDDDEVVSPPRRGKKGKKKRQPSSGGGSNDPSSSRSSWTDSTATTSEVRSLLKKKITGKDDRPRSSLGSVKIEEFYGGRSRYRKWKTAVQAQEVLYRLEEEELSMLIYLSTKKDARDVLDQQPISEFTKPGGIKLVWKLLDEAFGETEEELFERAEMECNTYRRIPGQSIATYLGQLKRLKAQYMRVDPQSIMSDRAWAQRMLNRSGLSRRKRLDVFFSAGGKYQAKEIENALRHRYGRVYEDERKLPVHVHGRGVVRPMTKKPFVAKGGKGFKKGEKKVFYEDGGTKEDEQEEDLEEDEEALGVYLEQQEQEEGRQDLEAIEEEEEPDFEEESLGEEKLKEAWAAGWKAKSQQNKKKRYRGWKGSGTGQGSSASNASAMPDRRKANLTCLSCGEVGHWKGDPQCKHVQSGRDKPHKKRENGIHVSSTMEGTNVHFNYVMTAVKKVKTEKEEEKEERRCPNPECQSLLKKEDKFCLACGIRAPSDESMREKRGWDVIDIEQGPSIEVISSGEFE